MINRLTFYQKYKSYFGSINDSQLQGLNFLLDKLDASKLINDAREYAYILATVYHECAVKWQPIKEMGGVAYLSHKRYYPYFGRGYVQLTWDFNYKAFGALLGIDLYNSPGLALEPENAWNILEQGMTNETHTFNDLSFTKHTLEQYFTDNITDWVGARRIINGTDCANLIAGYAKKFYDCIEFTSNGEGENGEGSIETKAEAVNPVEPDEVAATQELEAHKAILDATPTE